MSKLVPLPFKTSADDHANAETERKTQLFEWADRVLAELGVADRVSRASSLEELRKISLDVDSVEVRLAVRDALHPVNGSKADHFVGMKEGALKALLRSRFNDLKHQREFDLRNGRGAAGTAGTAGGKRSAYNWTDDLKLDPKGGVRPLLANLILFLRHHAKWRDVLAFDEFNARVVVRKRPPWGEAGSDAPWTDHHEALTRVWFQGEDINAGQGDVARAVQAAARHNPFHPVRDYFDALAWDGKPRLDKWLVTYFHSDDTEYVRAIGPRWLISSVARIYQPGCQVDHTLVLEGPQGRLKSQALRTLPKSQSWFTDRLSHIGSKDAAIDIAGIQIIELAEMDALTKAASSTSKQYLSRQHDRFRWPYGKHTINLLRQCVFAATINPPAGGYLKDPTGARRFWPVTCHGTIDRDAIELDRDQLWAEAVARFRSGAKWWLETPELEALATSEQAARFKADVWSEPVAAWLGKRTDVGIAEVLEHALGFAPSAQSHSAEIRVANILTNLGFTKYRPRKGQQRPHRYQKT